MQPRSVRGRGCRIAVASCRSVGGASVLRFVGGIPCADTAVDGHKPQTDGRDRAKCLGAVAPVGSPARPGHSAARSTSLPALGELARPWARCPLWGHLRGPSQCDVASASETIYVSVVALTRWGDAVGAQRLARRRLRERRARSARRVCVTRPSRRVRVGATRLVWSGRAARHVCAASAARDELVPGAVGTSRRGWCVFGEAAARVRGRRALHEASAPKGFIAHGVKRSDEDVTLRGQCRPDRGRGGRGCRRLGRGRCGALRLEVSPPSSDFGDAVVGGSGRGHSACACGGHGTTRHVRLDSGGCNLAPGSKVLAFLVPARPEACT